MVPNKKNNIKKWKKWTFGTFLLLPVFALFFTNNSFTSSSTPSNQQNNILTKSLENNRIAKSTYSLAKVKDLSDNSKKFKEIYLADSRDGEKFFSLIYENNTLYFKVNQDDALLKSANLSKNRGVDIDKTNAVSFASNVLSIDKISIDQDGTSSYKTSIINTNDINLLDSPIFISNNNGSYFRSGDRRKIDLDFTNDSTYLVRFYLDSRTISNKLSIFYSDGNDNIIDVNSDKELQSSINMYSKDSSIGIEGYITKTSDGVTFSFANDSTVGKNSITGNVRENIFDELKNDRADVALSKIAIGDPNNSTNDEFSWTNFFKELKLNGFSDSQIVLSSFEVLANNTNGQIDVSVIIPIINSISTPTIGIKHFVYDRSIVSQKFYITGFNTGSFLLKNNFSVSIKMLPESSINDPHYLSQIYRTVFEEGFGENNLLDSFNPQIDFKIDNAIVNNLTGTIQANLIVLNHYWENNGIAITNNIPKNFGSITISDFNTIIPTTQISDQLLLSSDSPFAQITASEASRNQSDLISIIFENRDFILDNLPSIITTSKNVTINDFIISNITVNDLNGTIDLTGKLKYYFNSVSGSYDNDEPFVFNLKILGFKKVILQTIINNNPNPSTDLQKILAQNITDLSNNVFKQYLYDEVIGGSKNGITVDDIQSIKIKSFDNMRGILILNSITLNKYYDANNELKSDNFTFDCGNIVISSFKKVVPTKLNALFFNFQQELNNSLASTMTSEELTHLLSVKYNEILVSNSLPEDFDENNITAPSKILEVNDKHGTLVAKFNINNFYNEYGVLETSSSKEFGPITITGFRVNTFATTINQSPNVGKTALNNVLAQTISQLPNPLSNKIFKQYLYDYVVGGEKNGISVDDIKAVTIKHNSFNNTNGSLIIDSITLGKWYDPDNSILQLSDKTFKQVIQISDFQTIFPTIINDLQTTINSKLDGTNVLDVSDEQLKQIIFDAKDNLFKIGSLPNLNMENIFISKRIGYKPDALKVNIELNSFYNDDQQGTFITNQKKEFGPIIIDGFKKTGLGTYLQESSININLDIYPYEIKNNSNFDHTIKQFIFENILQAKHGLTIDSITSYTIASNYPFDNKNGTLSLQSIILKDWLDDDGTIHRDQPKVYSTSNNIKICGFKKIDGATANSNNHESISVDGEVSKLKISELINNPQNTLLLDWIQKNKSKLFVNLPNNANITIESVNSNNSDTTAGLLNLNLCLSSYFDNDIFYSYKDGAKIFSLTLKNFKTEESLLTRIVDKKQFISPSELSDTLAQTICEGKVNQNTITFFKDFLLREVLIGKREKIEVMNYESSFDNTRGVVYLNAITLDKMYDKNGVLIKGKKFDNLNIEIFGFKEVVATSLINKEISIDSNNVLKNNYAIKLQTLVKNNDFNTIEQLRQLIFTKKSDIFAINSLPSDFDPKNIIDFTTTNINYNDLAYESLRKGKLTIDFKLNNFYSGSTGVLLTQPSQQFTLTLTNLKIDTLSTSLDFKTIIIDNIQDKYPFNFNKTKIIEWISLEINQKRNNEIIVSDINYISNNKAGTIEISQVVLANIIDCEGQSNNNDGLGWVFKKRITIEGMEKVNTPTKDVQKLELTGDLKKYESQDVSDKQLIDWFNQNKQSIFHNLPIDGSVIKIKRLSSTYDGILEIEITLSATYKNDNLYSYDPGTKMRVILSGFVKTDIFQIVPIIAGSVAAGIVVMIVVILAIYFYRKKKSGKVYVISEEDI